MTLTSPRGNPLEKIDGNTGSMSYWHGVFTRVGSKLSSLRTTVQSVQDLDGVGASIAAARSDAQDIATTLTPDIVEAELLASVLQAYADAFDSSAKRANDLIDDIEAAHAAWERESDAATSAGQNALWTSRSDDGEEAAEANAQARDAIAVRDAAKGALDQLWVEFDGYYAAWDEAYDAALAQLATGSGSILTLAAKDLLADLLAAGSPEAVAELWRTHPELWVELITQHPEIIGNLDGVPWDVRATVNVARLDRMLGTEPPGDRRDELEEIRRALEVGTPPPSLLSFDPDGSEQVTAAIAHGDLSTATVINTLIPGMNATVGDLQSWGESAKTLNEPGYATVVWFGYDTPNLMEEPGMGRAEDGAAALRSYLLAVRALSPEADSNVIAHSYGSTTAALAIGSQPDGLGVTSFIAVGSAGFPNDPTVVDNLSNGTTQVFATISEDDAVARFGRGTAPNHSVAPERLPGSTFFGSDGGVDASGGQLPASTGHDALGPGAYLEPGSESFYNVSEIIATGQPGTEINGAGSTSGFWDAGNAWISDEYAFFDL